MSAAIGFREASLSDREAILDLRRRCFAAEDAEKLDPSFFDWEFRRGRLFVGEIDGRVVTHIAFVPADYRIDGDTVKGALAVDAMTDPAARGHGAYTGVVAFALASLRSDLAIATAYQIRPAVLGAMLRTGWSIEANARVFVRPAKILFAPADDGSRTSRILGVDDTRAMAETDGISGCIARSPEWIRWRFFESPRWSYVVRGVEENGRLVAYLAARRTTLKGMDTYAIADLRFRSRDAAHALVRESIRDARRIGCRLVAALTTGDHPVRRLLIRHGFLPGPHRFRLLVHEMNGEARLANVRWRMMWADTDHL